MSRNPKHVVKTDATVLRIIETVAELQGAGVTRIADRVDLSKSAVYKHLSTLEQEEYLVKEGDDYHLGLRFVELGERARHRERIYEIAKPQIEQLAEETGELALVMVEEYGEGVLLDSATGDDAIHLDARDGKVLPLHSNALGKALLAHLPEERVAEILDRRGLPRSTSRTITDRDELFAELEAVRERGWAYTREERLSGVRCVAAPIIGASGDACAAIGVAGPTSRLEGERFSEEVPKQVLRAKNIVELNATYE